MPNACCLLPDSDLTPQASRLTPSEGVAPEDLDPIYTYDLNGNQTQKTAKIGGAVTQYEFDAENKLVRVISPSATINYRYDGLGRRVEKEVIAGTTTVTKYVYDNEDILLELNGANAIVARYTSAPAGGSFEPACRRNQDFQSVMRCHRL